MAEPRRGDVPTEPIAEGEPTVEGDAAAERRRRRERAARLLGDVVPSTTRDETAEGWSEGPESSRDADLLRDVPPHHGR